MATRRRSASSQENDERLLDAALDEIVSVGVDRLGMSAVARRAGLTTGALYGRYENANELAAEVWTHRVRDPHFDFLDRAVRGLVDCDPSVELGELARELSKPSPATVAALELVATSRRIDELEEIVGPDVEDRLGQWGAGPRARDVRRRAQVLFTLGSLWGALIHAIPRAHPVDWPEVLAIVGQSYARPYDVPTSRFTPERTGAVRAETGDRSESALIDSVSTIVGRVGFERATTSRIARRAGFTSGAIYARYRAKDELLTRAVDVLLAKRLADDLAANQGTYFRAPNLGAATAQIVGGYLTAALVASGVTFGSRRNSRRGTGRAFPRRSTESKRTPSGSTSSHSEPTPRQSNVRSATWRGSPRSCRSGSRSWISSHPRSAASTGAGSSCHSSRPARSRRQSSSRRRRRAPSTLFRSGVAKRGRQHRVRKAVVVKIRVRCGRHHHHEECQFPRNRRAEPCDSSFIPGQREVGAPVGRLPPLAICGLPEMRGTPTRTHCLVACPAKGA